MLISTEKYITTQKVSPQKKRHSSFLYFTFVFINYNRVILLIERKTEKISINFKPSNLFFLCVTVISIIFICLSFCVFECVFVYFCICFCRFLCVCVCPRLCIFFCVFLYMFLCVSMYVLDTKVICNLTHNTHKAHTSTHKMKHTRHDTHLHNVIHNDTRNHTH